MTPFKLRAPFRLRSVYMFGRVVGYAVFAIWGQFGKQVQTVGGDYR